MKPLSKNIIAFKCLTPHVPILFVRRKLAWPACTEAIDRYTLRYKRNEYICEFLQSWFASDIILGNVVNSN